MLLSLLLAVAAPASARDRKLSVVPENAQVERLPASGGEALPGFAWNADLTLVAYAARRGDQRLLVVGSKAVPVDEVEYLGFTPDQEDAVSICRENGRDVLRFGVKEAARYERIRPPVFAGRHAAFAAKEHGRWFIVRDGKPDRPADAVGSPVFSADGRRLAYWRREGSQALLLVDDSPAAAVQAPDTEGLAGLEDPSFSPDGSRLAYTLRRPDGKAAVSIDGRQGFPYGDVGRVVWSADGRRFMYNAAFSASADPGMILIDGQAIDRVGAGKLERVWPYRFEPDGQPVFVAGLEGGKEILSRADGVEGPFDGVQMPVRGPGGLEAFVVKKSSEFYVEEGFRAEQGPYDSVSDLGFDDVGRPFFAAAKAGRQFVVHNGKAEPAHDEVGRPVASGAALAYWAEDGGVWRVVAGGKPVGPAAVKGGFLTLRGSTPVATFQASDGWRLAVGEKSFGPFDELGPTRVRDRSVRVGVRQGRELWAREFPIP